MRQKLASEKKPKERPALPNIPNTKKFHLQVQSTQDVVFPEMAHAFRYHIIYSGNQLRDFIHNQSSPETITCSSQKKNLLIGPSQ